MPHTARQEKHIQWLRQAGISITLPRLGLLRLLEDSGKALTAHHLYRMHRDSGHGVPLSTIYVNLKRLEDARLLTRIRLEAESKNLYCITTASSPIRLVCRQCGQLSCIQDAHIDHLMAHACHRQGYAMQHYGITLEALCPECAPSAS